MSNGLDAAVSLYPYARAIKTAGFDFAIRYYSHTPAKNLTRDEALHLSEEGLYVVSVWETAGDHPSFFTHDKGRQDAINAIQYAQNIIEQPAGTPIYFAVDFDASVGDVAVRIKPYFQGIAEVMAENGHPYTVGAYGSGAVLTSLLAANLISYAWLAMARGWRGSKNFKAWNLKQQKQMFFHGVDVDTDVSNGNGGGWKVS